MEKKQTVIQDLLEFCEYRQTKAADGCKSAWNMILSKIKDDGLLEREKEQIIDGYNEGCYNSSDFPKTTDAENYYNETYKIKKWTREESEQNKDKLLQEIQEEPFNISGENLDWVAKELDQLIDEEEVRQNNKIKK